MKKLKKISLIIFLFILYLYAVAIDNIPNSVILFEGEALNINTLFGITIKSNDEDYDIIATSSSINGQNFTQTGATTLAVNLFGEFTIKTIDVNVIENAYVIPVGSIAGVKLYTNGVLVVGMSEVEGENNNKYKPYENSGIEEGDTIITINDEEISSTDDLINIVENSQGQELKIKYFQDGNEKETTITPVKMQNGTYKLGLWVRDSAAGIGTVTFYNPDTNTFGALGHGLTDIDTNELLEISSGKFVTTQIISIVKGQKNSPGKIQGTIKNQTTLGEITKNTKFGIYGTVTDLSSINIDTSNLMQVASRSEITTGNATILCDLDGTGCKEYEIEISKIFINNNDNNKSMLIKITDEDLLSKTGGIIQGMSGSPIIQNGKFIGAVTHVLVNDPTTGYAIFGDIMITEASN
jgi:stage IV sporulation protein B